MLKNHVGVSVTQSIKLSHREQKHKRLKFVQQSWLYIITEPFHFYRQPSTYCISNVYSRKKILSYTSYFFGCKRPQSVLLLSFVINVLSAVMCLVLVFIFPQLPGHWEILKEKEKLSVWYINWSFVYCIRTSLCTLATELRLSRFHCHAIKT